MVSTRRTPEPSQHPSAISFHHSGRVTRRSARQRSVESLISESLGAEQNVAHNAKRLSMVQERIEDDEDDQDVDEEAGEAELKSAPSGLIEEADEELDHSHAISGTTANSATAEPNPILMRLTLAGAWTDASNSLKYISRLTRGTQGISQHGIAQLQERWASDGDKLKSGFTAMSALLRSRLEILSSGKFIEPKAVTLQMLEGKDIKTLDPSHRLDDIFLKINLACFTHALLDDSDPESLLPHLSDMAATFPLPFATRFDEGSRAKPGGTSLVDESFEMIVEIKTQIVVAQVMQGKMSIGPAEIIGPQFFQVPKDETQGWDIDELIENGAVKTWDQVTRNRDIRNKYEAIALRRAKELWANVDREEDEFEAIEGIFPWDDFVNKALWFIHLREKELDKRIKARGGASRIIQGFNDEVDPSDGTGESQDQAEEEARPDSPQFVVDDGSYTLPPLEQLLQPLSPNRTSPSAQPEAPVLDRTEKPPATVFTSPAGKATTATPTKRPEFHTSPAQRRQMVSASPARTLPAVGSAAGETTIDPFALLVARARTQATRPADGEKENHPRKFIDRQPGASRVQFDESQREQTQEREETPTERASSLGSRQREDDEDDEDEDNEYQEDQRGPQLKRRRLPGVDSYHTQRSSIRSSPPPALSAAPSTPPIARSTPATSRALPTTQRGATRTARVRRRWTQEEETQLKLLMARFPNQWSRIKQEDEVCGNVLVHRTQVDLKDKARTLRYQMEKTQEGVAPGFEHTTLRKEHVEDLNRVWDGRKTF